MIHWSVAVCFMLGGFFWGKFVARQAMRNDMEAEVNAMLKKQILECCEDELFVGRYIKKDL